MHTLLARQLRRHRGTQDYPSEWRSFMEAVDAAYAEFDVDRRMLERSLELSSQELTQANRELAAVVDALPDTVIRLDQNDRVVTIAGPCNDCRPPGAVRGARIYEFLPHVAEQFLRAIQAVRQGARTDAVEFTMGEGLVRRFFEARVAPSFDDHVVVIVRDVTERERAEDMRVAVQAAQEASRAKSAFVANMSHELRTPLNAIIGYTELLVEDAVDRRDTSLTVDLERISTAARHLLSIVNDVLDLAKIEAQATDVFCEEFPIAELLGEVGQSLLPLAWRGKNTLDIRPFVGTLISDRGKVRQILLNLGGNACKFTESGVVELTTEHVAHDDADWVVFRVRDTGIGISPEQLSRVFNAFVQADTHTVRRYGGTGLGLTISQKLAHLLGGRVEVTSVVGRGSVFSLWLPAASTTCPVA